MLAGMRTRKGAWVKPGRSGGPYLPGSYRDYTYVRAPPAEYPTTKQQKAIGDKGRCVRKECTGKTGPAFFECRRTCVGG